jgi:hypothetical protein
MPKKEEKSTIKPKNTPGRPSDYTREIGDRICGIIATTSFSLSKIAVDNDFPNPSTIRRWIAKLPEFRDNYARAKLAQANILAEECLEIADNSVNENYNVDRLRIDTRKWLASKLLPKQYGDRVLLEQKTEENEQLKEELLALRKELDSRNKKEF